jgi:hypothetical protein
MWNICPPLYFAGEGACSTTFDTLQKIFGLLRGFSQKSQVETSAKKSNAADALKKMPRFSYKTY